MGLSEERKEGLNIGLNEERFKVLSKLHVQSEEYRHKIFRNLFDHLR